MRVVEVIFVEDCPNAQEAVLGARAAIAQAGITAELRELRVESEDAARRMRFLGSPTIRVDGKDVDASAVDRDDYGMQCRVYEADGRLLRHPPTAWIVAALR